jgi:hypothetical protein
VREEISSRGSGKRAQTSVTDATADNSISGKSRQINADEFLGPTGSPRALAVTAR